MENNVSEAPSKCTSWSIWSTITEITKLFSSATISSKSESKNDKTASQTTKNLTPTKASLIPKATPRTNQGKRNKTSANKGGISKNMSKNKVISNSKSKRRRNF
jgi:hypothetical protein